MKSKLVSARLDAEAYFESLTAEVMALKNRIRNFIGAAHWQTDGLWKESVIKAVLRRYLPGAVGVGTGFVVTDAGPTTQIDVLLHDLNKPVLFRDGDFVIVTADAALGLIEVKTRIMQAQLEGVCAKIYDAAKKSRSQHTTTRPFVGVISFEDTNIDPNRMLDAIYNVAGEAGGPEFNCLSVGSSYFVRFWNLPPKLSNKPINRWHAYHLKNKAPAYFLHNVIEALFPQSILENNRMWYPENGKEDYKIGERDRNGIGR
jgi:hypothetical protein